MVDFFNDTGDYPSIVLSFEDRVYNIYYTSQDNGEVNYFLVDKDIINKILKS